MTVKLLDDVTPLLITLDEEPNIERTLGALAWAREIVVVDSGSTDGTLEILAARKGARVLHRPFDSFASQCGFGLEQGEIQTGWVLSLDADHVLSPTLLEELERLDPAPETAGFRAGFTYCISGRPLRGSLYPPRVVLFRKGKGRYEDDGHGHRIAVDGLVVALKGRILHDDRKSLSRWLREQARYSAAEARKLTTVDRSALSLQDRIRKLAVVAPFLVFIYCLVVKGGILDGRAGWHYAFQRLIAEAILSLRLLEQKIGHQPRETKEP